MTRFWTCTLTICLLALASAAHAAQAPSVEDLVLSARMGNLEAVEICLKAGIGPDVLDSNGETALGWATFNGHIGVVEALLSNGADANQKNRYGNTPIIYAAAKGHTEILNALIDAGAQPSVRGRGNLTPLVLAARDGHSETVRALLKTKSENDPGKAVALAVAKR